MALIRLHRQEAQMKLTVAVAQAGPDVFVHRANRKPLTQLR
jgi:hypothetical protein